MCVCVYSVRSEMGSWCSFCAVFVVVFLFQERCRSWSIAEWFKGLRGHDVNVRRGKCHCPLSPLRVVDPELSLSGEDGGGGGGGGASPISLSLPPPLSVSFLLSLPCLLLAFHVCLWRCGDRPLVERRTRDRKVAGSIPGRSGGRTFVFMVKILC